MKPYYSGIDIAGQVKAVCNVRGYKIGAIEEQLGKCVGYFSRHSAKGIGIPFAVILDTCNILEMSVDELIAFDDTEFMIEKLHNAIAALENQITTLRGAKA